MDVYETNQQLGSEFLTWLWYLTETSGCTLALDAEQLELMMDAELVLENDAKEIDILRHGHPSVSGEATAALLSGKKAVRAKLCLAKGQEVWVFTLDRRLQLRAVRLPRGEADHPLDIFQEQMQALEELSAAVDELYRTFLTKRLGGNWPAELKKMRSWIGSRSSNQAPDPADATLP